MPFKDPQKNKDYQKNWIKLKRERTQESQRKYLRSLRIRVIEKLGGKCVNCGCDNFAALEINHIKGCGRKDRRVGSKQYYLSILSDKIKDLEMTCIVCNALHKAKVINKIEDDWVISWQRHH